MNGANAARAKRALLEIPTRRPPPEEGVMVTDLSLTPVACDSGAAAILANPNATVRQGGALRLPPEVVEAFRGRKPAELGDVRSSFVRGKSRYKCRAFVIEPWNSALPAAMVAFTFQRDPCVDDAVAHVAAQYGLTGREREVLKGVAAGLTSKELAGRMGIKPNTVKAFLRLIMGKMGVATRAGLVGKLLE